MDARVNIDEDLFASDKNLAYFSRVTLTLKFCRHICAGPLRAGLCHAFLVVILMALFQTPPGPFNPHSRV